eukprot:COSAG06_NODE_5613_length_3363_cov_1.348346_3_plen_208_part_00
MSSHDTGTGGFVFRPDWGTTGAFGGWGAAVAEAMGLLGNLEAMMQLLEGSAYVAAEGAIGQAYSVTRPVRTNVTMLPHLISESADARAVPTVLNSKESDKTQSANRLLRLLAAQVPGSPARDAITPPFKPVYGLTRFHELGGGYAASAILRTVFGLRPPLGCEGAGCLYRPEARRGSLEAVLHGVAMPGGSYGTTTADGEGLKWTPA